MGIWGRGVKSRKRPWGRAFQRPGRGFSGDLHLPKEKFKLAASQISLRQEGIPELTKRMLPPSLYNWLRSLIGAPRMGPDVAWNCTIAVAEGSTNSSAEVGRNPGKVLTHIFRQGLSTCS